MPLSKESLVANTLHPAPFRMALLDATTANDDSIVVAFSDDDDDDDESMIFNHRLFRRRRRCLFPIERRVRFCAPPPPPPRVPRRRKWNGEGESAVPSFDMRARVFGAQRRQRILSPNEEKTTKIFLHPKSPHNIYSTKKERNKKRRDVRRRNERHHLYKVTFVCVLK